MQFLSIALALAACSSLTKAMVFKGQLNGNNIAWFGGADMCEDDSHIVLNGDICSVSYSLPRSLSSCCG